jgi:hypothetical protein
MFKLALALIASVEAFQLGSHSRKAFEAETKLS